MKKMLRKGKSSKGFVKILGVILKLRWAVIAKKIKFSLDLKSTSGRIIKIVY